ncbi:MAG TPA: CapA family protein [Anaerolineaceae bacterium]|nr:CapA family protein [Anaerolineaceae bacterium]
MPTQKKLYWLLVSLILTFSLLLQACTPFSPANPAIQPTIEGRPSGTQEVTNISPEALVNAEATTTQLPSTPTSEPSPTSPAPCLALDPNLPPQIISSLKTLQPDFQCLSSSQPRQTLTFLKTGQLSAWVYALVAPFNTVTDDLPIKDLLEFWSGITEKPFTQLAMSSSTKAAMISLFGEPKGVISEQAEGALVDFAWQTPGTWAIVPFEALEPRWKVINLDGNSPIRKDFDAQQYPLLAHIGLESPESAGTLNDHLQSVMVSTNRDPKKLTTVIVTGTTALVRATAYAMEQEGIDKPAAVIGSILSQADITHVSNEISYSADCPFPNPVTQSMSFCAPFSYNQVLEEIGTDVVDLTGDHFVDWGHGAAIETVDLYNKLGWQTFGGGQNLEEAQKPALFEVNGNKIAFIGCNAKHAYWNVATAETPGALDCDTDFLHEQIRSLKNEGYTVITTFQHYEDYGWFPDTALEYDFQQAALAGADIVSGSQAHRPQVYTFAGTEQKQFIHFGLGNLFFDQILLGNDCDKGFVDRHVIYDGKYISTEMLSIILPNFLQPVWMTPQERGYFLGTLHKYSDIYRNTLNEQP